MKTSDLKERIVIQKLENIVDEEGFDVECWIDYHKCWSCFRTVGWKEYFSAAAIQAQNTVTFTIRFSNKIKVMLEDIKVTKYYRILYKKREYDIKYVCDLDNRHEYVDIKAESIT